MWHQYILLGHTILSASSARRQSTECIAYPERPLRLHYAFSKASHFTGGSEPAYCFLTSDSDEVIHIRSMVYLRQLANDRNDRILAALSLPHTILLKVFHLQAIPDTGPNRTIGS